jgi:hypothetical protein
MVEERSQLSLRKEPEAHFDRQGPEPSHRNQMKLETTLLLEPSTLPLHPLPTTTSSSSNPTLTKIPPSPVSPSTSPTSRSYKTPSTNAFTIVIETHAVNAANLVAQVVEVSVQTALDSALLGCRLAVAARDGRVSERDAVNSACKFDAGVGVGSSASTPSPRFQRAVRSVACNHLRNILGQFGCELGSSVL